MIKSLFLGIAFSLLLISCSKEQNNDIYYSLKVVPDAGGSVSNNGFKSIPGATFIFTAVEGTNVTITAYPEEGNTFDGWSDGSSSNPYTLTLDKSMEFEAYFSLQ